MNRSLHITNTTGRPTDTKVTDGDGVELSAHLRRVVVDVSDNVIQAELGAVNVTMDMIAQLKDIRIEGDISILKIDKRTHGYKIANETEDSVDIQIYSL